jgi:DNA replication and repair protein RecF
VSLAAFSVDHLRCLEHATLDLHPGHNLIWGSNASGKTSLLESIFLLGRGRSFRTRNSERLIRHGHDKLVVFGRTDDTPSKTLGVQVSRAEGTIAKISGQFAQSLADLTCAFAVQVIEPGIHRLVEEGGHRRRRWMDWAVFHVEPNFIEAWSSYTRSLKQRNAALKTQPQQAAAWDPELIRLGEAIAESRRAFIDRLQPYWLQVTAELLGAQVDLHYARGWPQGISLAEALVIARDRDAQRGLTHAGPHRADVLIRIGSKAARDILSRGQQKLVAIAMTLAQLRLIREVSGTTPTLLLDDPAAELDRNRLERFAEQVNALQCQLVVTALSAQLDPLGSPDRAFHVEQGRMEPYNAPP